MSTQLASTDDLLLVALTSESPSGEPTPPGPDHGRPLSALLQTVGGNGPLLSQQVEIVAAIEALVDAELIERISADGKPVLSLTEAGADRAQDLRMELADTPIKVVEEGSRRQLSLGEATTELDRSLVELVTECTDEHVYHCQDEPARGGVAGRNHERETWARTLEQVAEKRSGEAIFLTGPGGIGKTTLADAMLDDARADGFDVVAARCHGADSEPYQPIRALLERVAPEADPFARPGIAVDDADAFEAQRTALFHDVTDRFVPTAVEPPRVLFLDDVHLADTATLGYLECLLERLSDEPLLLLGSYRPAALPGDAPMTSNVVTDLDCTTEIRLGELDRGATRRMIEAILGRTGVPEDFLAAVHEYTGGHPLFVRSVVETLLDTDQLDPNFEWYPEDPAAIEVPDAVRSTVEQFVNGLDDRAHEVLQWAAIAGESVPVPVLDQVCDLSSGALETTLTVLSEASLFHRNTDRDLVTFTSEVVRETLVSAPDDDERRRRHAAIATALEATVTTERGADERVIDRAATIAHHDDEAGHTEAAVDWYRTAARRATDVYAHQVAIEHSHRALDLARTTDEAERLLSVGTELAERYVTTGEYETARQYVQFVRQRVDPDETARRQHLALISAEAACSQGEFQRAIQESTDGLGFDERAPEARCRLLDVKSRAEVDKGDYEAAHETALGLRELADRIDDAELEGAALRHLGEIAKQRNDYDDSREYFDRALDHYEAIADRHGVAKTTNNIGMLEYRQSAYDEARTYYEQARSEFEAVGDRHGIAQVNLDLGNTAWRQADHDSAREYYRTALEGLRAVGDRHGVAKARLNLGNVARDTGAYGEAREWFEQALEGYRDVGDRHSVAHAHLNLGSVLQSEGDYVEAGEYHRQALEGYRAVGDDHRAALSLLNLGYVARHRGAYETACEHLAAGLEGCQAVGDDHNTALARNNLARVAIARGNYDRASNLASQALEGFRDVGNHDEVAKVLTTLGTVARKQGAVDRASDLLSDAVEALDAGGDHHDAAWVSIELGTLARLRGEHEPAREHLQEAIDSATDREDRHATARAHGQLAAVARQEGALGRAETHAERALADHRAVGDRHGVAIVHLRLARLARDREEYETARRHAESVHETFEAIGASHWAARARYVLGTVAAATDAHEDACEQFERALETFDAVGAATESLETLADLVEATREIGDTDAALQWCRRAVSFADDHEPTVGEVDREWFERRRASLDTDAESTATE